MLVPQPEELGQDRPDEAVDQDVGPHQLAGQLEGLEARVVQHQEARPQQQQVEQTHEPWGHHGSLIPSSSRVTTGQGSQSNTTQDHQHNKTHKN